VKLTNLADLLGEKAVKHFTEGYNCSQSVLLTMAEHWKCKDELIPKVASTFGGGMGRCGSVCGAVTGGLMAIGIQRGTNEPPSKSAEKSTRAYQLAGTFYRQFEKQNGTVMCRDLIGLDLSDPEQLKKAREDHVFDKRCTVFIKSAIEILATLGLDAT